MSMLHIHENNILTKLNTSKEYKRVKSELEAFYLQEYMSMRGKVESLSFKENNKDAFIKATKIFNDYAKKLGDFAKEYKISSQSKFESTFLEEISVYLFKDIPEIKNGEYGIYNKNIYAGLKIDNNKNISIIGKDVDFCIGKKARLTIDKQRGLDLILPIVAVEVKTYLDATMFGEIKSSSKAIRSASPNSKTYVLMGYKNIASEHIISARQDSTVSELFVLKENAEDKIHWEVIYDYWKQIVHDIKIVSSPDKVNSVGRQLF